MKKFLTVLAIALIAMTAVFAATNKSSDLTLKLMVPTEIAIARKPEMTTEEIENKKTAVRAMNFAIRSVEVDTSQDITKSLSHIMKEIWQII